MARSSLDPEHEQRILALLSEAHEIADDDADLKLHKAENKAALKKAYRRAGIEQALIVDGRICSVTLKPSAEDGPLYRTDGAPTEISRLR